MIGKPAPPRQWAAAAVDPASSAADARGAALADLAIAAGLEAVTHGQRSSAVARLVVAAAVGGGAEPGSVRVRVTPAGELRKAATVSIALRGCRGGHPFALARTTVVGYDTFPRVTAAGDAVLKALGAGLAGCVPGATPEEMTAVAPLPVRLIVRPLRREAEVAQGAQDGASLLYVAAYATAGAHGRVAVGDMVHPAAAGGVLVTRLPRRLWL
jgi:hypothetical protein